MNSVETSETSTVARLLTMGAVALVAFAFVLTVGLSTAESILELALGAAVVATAAVAAIACLKTSAHISNSRDAAGSSFGRLVPIRVKR